MTGFARALRGELYQLLHRRPILLAHLAVLLVAVARVVAGRLVLGAAHAAGGPGPGEVGAWNAWPQFAHGVRAAAFLVELFVLVLVGAGLPREVASGSVRDPLTRRITRPALIAARGVTALVLPLTLLACAVLGSLAAASALFDAGDVMEDGEVLISVADDGLDVAVRDAVLHGVPALLALGGLALFLGAASRRSVSAVGAGLALVLAPTLFRETLGDRAPWWFADTLPGLGPDSFLARIARFAEGYTDAWPETFDRVVAVGWKAPWPALFLAWVGAILVFRRRAV